MICALLILLGFLAFAVDHEDEAYGLENQIGEEGDAEEEDEHLALAGPVGGGGGIAAKVGEHPHTQHHKVKEKASYSDPEVVLDKSPRVFVEALHDDIVLQSGDDGEIERDGRQNGLEQRAVEPHDEEGGQH